MNQTLKTMKKISIKLILPSILIENELIAIPEPTVNNIPSLEVHSSLEMV